MHYFNLNTWFHMIFITIFFFHPLVKFTHISCIYSILVKSSLRMVDSYFYIFVEMEMTSQVLCPVLDIQKMQRRFTLLKEEIVNRRQGTKIKYKFQAYDFSSFKVSYNLVILILTCDDKTMLVQNIKNVLKTLTSLLTISSFQHFLLCLTLFISFWRGIGRTYDLSSECKTDLAGFTNWIIFGLSNVMEEISPNSEALRTDT